LIWLVNINRRSAYTLLVSCFHFLVEAMNTRDLIGDLIATYRKHGWELKRVLLQSQTAAELSGELDPILGEAEIREAAIDALWFSRPSHKSGEAWELRLVAENPYALFERFGSEDSAEKRAETFESMEDQLCRYARP